MQWQQIVVSAVIFVSALATILSIGRKSNNQTTPKTAAAAVCIDAALIALVMSM